MFSIGDIIIGHHLGDLVIKNCPHRGEPRRAYVTGPSEDLPSFAWNHVFPGDEGGTICELTGELCNPVFEEGCCPALSPTGETCRRLVDGLGEAPCGHPLFTDGTNSYCLECDMVLMLPLALQADNELEVRHAA